MNEIWKDIEGYNGDYQVSNLGRVKSIKRKVSNGVGERIVKGRIKKNTITPSGYEHVKIQINQTQKTHYVHRLVTEAFIPNPENKPEVNHIDGDKSNNRVDNLEWVTKSENQQHAYDNGLKYCSEYQKQKVSESLLGEKHHSSIFTKEDIIIIRKRIKMGDRLCDIAKDYNCTGGAIWNIKARKTWRHVQ